MTAHLTITDPHMRSTHEAARPCIRTSTGILIGASHLRRQAPGAAQAISGPHRAMRARTSADRLVMVGCAIAALFLAGLLIVERLA